MTEQEKIEQAAYALATKQAIELSKKIYRNPLTFTDLKDLTLTDLMDSITTMKQTMSILVAKQHNHIGSCGCNVCCKLKAYGFIHPCHKFHSVCFFARNNLGIVASDGHYFFSFDVLEKKDWFIANQYGLRLIGQTTPPRPSRKN